MAGQGIELHVAGSGGAREKVDAVVIRAMRRQGGCLGFPEDPLEVVVLRWSAGEVRRRDNPGHDLRD